MGKCTYVDDKFYKYIATGNIWTGWLGGQWALSDAIFDQLRPDRGLVVLCGGPGDLAFNACYQNKTKFAINVDSSYDAIAYGLSLSSRFTPRCNYPKEVEGANRNFADASFFVPKVLVRPRLGTLGVFFRISRTTEHVYHIWDDALAFVQSTLADLPPVDVYIASPTILNCGGKALLFYSIYDFIFSTKRIGFSQWVTNEYEYLSILIQIIKRMQPEAKIIFGVGEGRTPVSDYLYLLCDGQLVHEERFLLSSGYTFTDWLLVYDPGAP